MKPLRMRRAITLLITLSVLAAMMALLGVLFSYLEKAREAVGEDAATIQADLLREDLESLLKKSLQGKERRKEERQVLFSTPLPLYDEEGRFGLLARCEPYADRIPLFWLGWEKKDPRRYELARKLFEELTQKAELQDPDRLFEMIVEDLWGKKREFGIDVFVNKRPGSFSAEEMRSIVREYRFEEDDPHVERIDWEGAFRLQSLTRPIRYLEKDFLSLQTVAYLFDQEIQTVKEDYAPGDLASYLETIGENEESYSWLFDKNGTLPIHCDVGYSFREKQYNITFDYREGRIENFAIQKE